MGKKGTVPQKKGEEWKQIDVPNDYFVSNLGRVRRNKRILRTAINQNGYYTCWINNKRKLVHRLVAEYFVPNPDNKRCVDHIDGNKLNNDATNLRFVTVAENTQAAYDLGLIKRTEIIAVDDQDQVVLYKTQADAARDLNLDTKTVNQVLQGLLDKAKGWRFLRMRSLTDKRGGKP